MDTELNCFIENDKYKKLQLFAQKISWHYYSSVYLVGSSLKKRDFLDVDIIVLMDDEDFECKYGKVDDWYNENVGVKEDKIVNNNWAKDCYKQWFFGCKITGLNLDFKILPKKYCEIKQPFIRLDNFEKNRNEFIQSSL